MIGVAQRLFLSAVGRLLALALGLFVCANAALAEVTIESLECGFGGRYKVGYWTPLRITLRSDTAATGVLEAIVPDSDGQPVRVVGPQVSLASGEPVSATVYAKIGRTQPNVILAVRDEAGTVLAERRFAEHGPPALLATQQLLLAIGADLDLASANAQARLPDPEKAFVVSVDDAAALPTEWYGFAGVDAIVVATSEPTVLDTLAADDPRRAALETWTQMGGTLVLSVARRAEEVFAEGQTLAPFAPGAVEGLAPFRQVSVLEAYAEAGVAIPVERGGRNVPRVPRFTGVDGAIEAWEGARPEDLPLVIRSTYGFGLVTTIAVDLDQPPFAKWGGRPAVMNRLLGRTAQRRDDAGDATLGQVTHLGYVDLSGQLRSALDQFAGVTLIPFWQVATVCFVYILLIGPVDYFLLRRFGRPEWTWLTFGLLVVLFSGGAMWWAQRGKASDVRLNQAEIVDVDLTRGDKADVRGTAWLTVYSPKTQQFDLQLVPRVDAFDASAERETLLSWMGLPGGAIGGLDSSTGADSGQPAYVLRPEVGQIESLPISVWSTKTLTARWRSTAAPLVTNELRLNRGLQELAGSFTYTGELPLEDCMLLHGRWAYPLGAITPGARIQLGSRYDPRTIETWLTYRRLSRSEVSGVEPYDKASVDVPRILQMVMFHAAAGGQRYTRLLSRYENDLDMTSHLRAGRAILLARGPQAAQLMRGGEPIAGDGDAAVTYYRFLLPVADAIGSASDR